MELDLKLKSADNTFLQDELNKAYANIDKKDKILSMLTDGLKEVICKIHRHLKTCTRLLKWYSFVRWK